MVKPQKIAILGPTLAKHESKADHQFSETFFYQNITSDVKLFYKLDIKNFTLLSYA